MYNIYIKIMSMLSNQHIINELKSIRNSFIKSRPEMEMNSFVSSRRKPYNLGDGSAHRLHTFMQGGGSPMVMPHPLSSGSINGNTLYPDPLYSGIVYRPAKGGALLNENMPLSGGYNSSEYDSEYDSDSDYEGGYFSDEGAGIYDDYIKPVAKKLSQGVYSLGKTALNDVITPIGKEVGKEVLKKALMGALMGAGHTYGGRLSGTREEFIHILKSIDPSFIPNRKHSKNDLRNEVYKHLESTMSKKDLATLHYLDALAGFPDYENNNEEGGINGNKSELSQILHKMYPELDLKKMSKEQIVKHIVSHVEKSKQSSNVEEYNKQLEKDRLKEEKIKAYDEKLRLREEKKLNKKGKNQNEGFKEIIFEEPPPAYSEFEEPPSVYSEFEEPPAVYSEFEEPIKYVPEKIKKPRGRPAKVKEVKEKKPRGRPAKVKEVKEKKPRGRPSKIKEATIKDPVKELDDIFKELENPKPAEDIIFPMRKMYNNDGTENKKKKGGKIKKLVGTKKGNRVRGDIVAEVMKKKGLTLPQASKYVSQHNLY